MLRFTGLLAVIVTSGCATIANSPIVVDQLKIRSAGFTGCAADTNQITNIDARPDGSGTWNATCQGKVYLCSQGSSEGHASSYSCAVAVN
jgi:outer membrane lipoprotein-sorting protein